MLKPGDLVKIKNTDEPWAHLSNKVGLFLQYESTHIVYTCCVKIGETQVLFREDELEYVCNIHEVDASRQNTKL